MGYFKAIRTDANGFVISVPTWEWDAVRDTKIDITGTWTRVASNQRFGGATISAPNDTDSVGFGAFNIQIAGVYTLYGWFERSTSQGILQFNLNGVDLGDIDMYGTVDNNYEASISMGSLSVGQHALQAIINSKNASSSGHACKIQTLWVVRV